MPAVFAVIGAIAGAVGTVAAVIGPVIGISAATISTIVGVASIVSAVAALGSMIFKPKPPPARGSVTKILVDPDAPAPYAMGEGPVGGVLRHDAGYGATLNGVPNPYRWLVTVMSVAGPVASVTPWADMAAVSSYYSGFLYTSTQLGAKPESASLSPHFAGPPGWDSTSKLSGKAAIGWNLLFDRAGKVFSSGVPKLAGYGQWVKVYDPRLDSTFPGGSGSQRFDDESTWAWSENPALHALTYARGRFVNNGTDDIKVMGVGLPKEGLDIVGAAAWANVCDANGWTIFGVVYEPGDRWANLKDICIAGGGEPIFAGGVLSWKYASPKTSLDTITEADLADGSQSVVPMASWRERVNTVVPKYRSPDHDWELVDATPISVSTYVTDDGQIKQVNWPFNMVKNVDQAAQLARYRLEDSREIVPIELVCMPRLKAYRPGECLHLDLPQLGLNHDAVILKREIDPATLAVKLTLTTETSGKHAFALGETGTPPPTPALVQDQQDRDIVAGAQVAQNLSLVGLGEVGVAADYTGAITDSLPRTINYTLKSDGTDVTTSSSWTVSTTSGTISASIGAATGVLSLNTSGGAMTDSVLSISASYGSGTVTQLVKVTINRASAPGGSGGGSSVSSGFSGSTSTTSMVAIGPELTILTGSGGQVDLWAAYTFTAPSGNRYEDAQWYWWNGSAYVALGSPVTGGPFVIGDPDPGYGSCNYTATGLGASTVQKFKLYMANTAGTVTRTITGDCGGVGS